MDFEHGLLGLCALILIVTCLMFGIDAYRDLQYAKLGLVQQQKTGGYGVIWVKP